MRTASSVPLDRMRGHFAGLATPQNSTNRVFILRGELHLVLGRVVPEMSEYGGNTKRKPSQTQRHSDEQRVFTQAIQAIANERVNTRSSVAMQHMLQQKISEAPHYIITDRTAIVCAVYYLLYPSGSSCRREAQDHWCCFRRVLLPRSTVPSLRTWNSSDREQTGGNRKLAAP